MTQRKGVTLTEVLVSIFVMGIGLLSLLVLFPLGALNMAQAIKDERFAIASANATSLANLTLGTNGQPLRDDSEVGPFYVTPTTAPTPVLMPLALSSGYSGPSYPVYIDPQGSSLILGSSRIGYLAVGNRVHPGFARTSLSWITQSGVPLPQLVSRQGLITRFFTLTDDITFNATGYADVTSGQILRDGRYSWAYMVRQGRASPTSPTPSPGVDLTIVVYERRPNVSATQPVGAPVTAPAICSGETAFPATFDAVTNSATLYAVNNVSPAVRKGAWILDASILDSFGNPPTTTQPTLIHNYFYRVSGVTQNANSSVTLDFQNPVRESVPLTTMPAGTTGVAVVLDNVVEVFEKGPN